jgi:hypothetical protein
MSVSAYPLQWPADRPRKSAGARLPGKFNKKVNKIILGETKAVSVALSINDAIQRLQDELDRIGARYPVVSTNLETRLDGLPRSGQSEPSDPGVALYFDIAAIAAHIEATRAIERHGVSSVAEMFAGFTALPAPGAKRSWREVLGLVGENNPTAEQVNHHFKIKAKSAHPDAGGSDAAMAELNVAKAEALKEIGG